MGLAKKNWDGKRSQIMKLKAGVSVQHHVGRKLGHARGSQSAPAHGLTTTGVSMLAKLS